MIYSFLYTEGGNVYSFTRGQHEARLHSGIMESININEVLSELQADLHLVSSIGEAADSDVPSSS